MGTRQKEDSTGERTKKRGVEFAVEENMSHILKKCEETRSEMQMGKFIGIGKGLDIMKRIDKARKKVEKKEKANKSGDLS